MTVKETSYVNSQKSPRGFMYLLSSAACEWFFMFLLFLDGTLSYLLTKYAQHCELHPHCLFCSRLDHVFGNEKPNCYKNLLCTDHRVEISSLVYCDVHDKLADARDMCEECLVLFIAQNKSSPDSYRLFSGKLGVDYERNGFSSPFPNNNFIPGSVSTRNCSCCNMPWRSKSNAHRLLHVAPMGYGARANVKPPLPRTPGRSRFSRRDSMKKMRDKFAEAPKNRGLGSYSDDTLSHVGYSELKLNSDSDSEFQFSDDDPRVMFKKEFLAQRKPENVPKTTHTQQVSSHGSASLLDQNVQLYENEARDAKHSPSDFARLGLGELIWENPNPNPKPHPSSFPELISLNDAHPSSNTIQGHVGVDSATDTPTGTLSRESSGFALSELTLLDFIPPSDTLTVPSAENVVDGREINDIEHTSVSKHVEYETSAPSEVVFKTDHVMHTHAQPIPSGVDSSSVTKLIGSNKDLALEVSSVDLKQTHPIDPKGVHEDAKVSPHIFSSIGIDRVHVHHEPLGRMDSTKDLALEVSSMDLKQPHPIESKGVQQDAKLSPKRSSSIGTNEGLGRTESSSSNGMPPIQTSTSLEIKESGYESIDGISTVSEVEGESLVDRLKRQIEHDKESMSALLKELEEERNAASIAANEAMAMITRLQEEKAALHMEALQYLRMMEEQAEYDMEALEKANDLLAEKEKEVQDLEAELEFYKTVIEDTMEMHDETYNLNGDQGMMVGRNCTYFVENHAYIPPNSTIVEGSDETTDVKTSSIVKDSMESDNLKGETMTVDNKDLQCIESNTYVPSNSMNVLGSDETKNVKTSSIVEDSMNLHDEAHNSKGETTTFDKSDSHDIKNNDHGPSNSMIIEGRDKTTKIMNSSTIEDSMNLHDEAHNSKGETMTVDNNDSHRIENNAHVPSNSMIIEGSEKTTDIKNSSTIEDSMNLHDEAHNLKGESTKVDNNDLHRIGNNAHVPSNSMIVEGSDEKIDVKTSPNNEDSMNKHDDAHGS